MPPHDDDSGRLDEVHESSGILPTLEEWLVQGRHSRCFEVLYFDILTPGNVSWFVTLLDHDACYGEITFRGSGPTIVHAIQGALEAAGAIRNASALQSK